MIAKKSCKREGFIDLNSFLKIGIWKERLGLVLIVLLLSVQSLASGCGCGAGKPEEQTVEQEVAAETAAESMAAEQTEAAESTAAEQTEATESTAAEPETAEAMTETPEAETLETEDTGSETEPSETEKAETETASAESTAAESTVSSESSTETAGQTKQQTEAEESTDTSNQAGTDATTGSETAQVVTSSGVVTGGHIVCIDPGHQRRGDNTKEPNGPGSTVMKARVTGGTTGTTTGVPEYMLTLQIGLALQTELQNRGYTVYMTRTTHDVNISNVERAQFANNAGAEICVRLHADGANSSSASGASTLAPSANNPYVSALSSQSQTLSTQILSAYCAATGMKNRGVSLNDTMTGINWCLMPVTILEMGFMTNPADDRNMQDPVYQAAMVQGIANGIDAYFGY